MSRLGLGVEPRLRPPAATSVPQPEKPQRAARRRGPRASPSTRTARRCAADRARRTRRSRRRSARARRTCDPRHAGAAHLGDPHRAPLPRRRPACPARTRRAGSRSGSASPAAAPAAARRRRRRRSSGGVRRSDRPRRGPASAAARRAPGRASTGRDRRPPRRPTPARRARGCGHWPIHGCGVPSNALEARKPGRPWKRDEDEKNAPRRRRAGRAAESVTSLGDARPAVDLPGARGRRARTRASRPRSPSPRSRTSAALAEPCSRARRNGSSPVVRWNRYVEAVARDVAPASARSASTGARSASRHRTPGISSSRMPAAPAVGPSGLRTVDDPDRQPRRRRSARPAAWFQPARTGYVVPLTTTAVDRRAGGRCRAAAAASPTSRGAVEVDLERVAVRGQRAVGLPVRRARRRRAPRTAGARGTAGSRARTARARAAMPS